MNEEMMQEQQAGESVGIILPQDYDVYYGVSGLNNEIRTLIRQAIESRDEEHKVEINELVEMYKQRIEVAETAVTEMTERFRQLQEENEQQVERISGLLKDLQKANELRQDAENKRDNAVRLMEEAQDEAKALRSENDRLKRKEESYKSQIDELESKLHNYNMKKPVGGIKLVSTLPALSEEEKKAKLERERMEFINRRLAEKYGDNNPLPVPSLPSSEKLEEDVTEEALQEQMKRVEEAAQADAATFQMVPSNAGTEEAEGGTTETGNDARSAGEEADAPTLEARIAALECWQSEVRELLAERLGTAV